MVWNVSTSVTIDTFNSSIDSDWDLPGGFWYDPVWQTGGYVNGPGNAQGAVMRDDTNTFDNDQYCEATLGSAQGGSGYAAAAVRMQADGSHYIGIGDPWNSRWEIYEFGDGPSIYASLASSATGWGLAASGDVLRTEMEGTTIRFGEDGGGSMTERVNTTDNTYSTGDPGTQTYRFSATADRITSVDMGDMGAASDVSQPFISPMRRKNLRHMLSR